MCHPACMWTSRYSPTYLSHLLSPGWLTWLEDIKGSVPSSLNLDLIKGKPLQEIGWREERD